MKKFYFLITALLILSLTSMMLIEKKDQQKTKPVTMPESKPLFQKGMITIKVKEGIGEFDKQRGDVTFNIPSLDAKANKYEVDLLEKRFKYNPKKLKDGLPDLSRIYRIEFPGKYSVTKVAEAFSKDPNIEYAEPIPICYPTEAPNDSLYSLQQYLPQIFAEETWEIHKGENGTEEVIIAIIDTGVDWDHEDLVDNTWQNLGEDVDGDGKTIEYITGEWVFDPDDENGIDDDENGFVDDFIGWNFHNSDNDPNPFPGTSSAAHGTYCAGLTSCATNNNIGTASISWNLFYMPVNSYDPDISGVGFGFEGILYAAENGAHIISNSWATDFYTQAGQDVVDYAIGVGCILVAASNNYNEFTNHYPADHAGVLSVAAVTSSDHKASFSNFGPNIAISAPGVGILCTALNDTYAPLNGTSLATPIVAGLFGLVRSYHPDWSSDQIITQVLGTVDKIDSINPGYENLLGSGRINAFRALTETVVTLEQEISIDLIHSICHDTDGDNMLQPGDTANMSFELRNYNWGVGAENAIFTLTTEDPDIIILDNSCSTDIPADNFFSLENIFQFKVSEGASVHMVDFKLIANADVEITWGDTTSFQVLVAPQGILVYQGEGSGNAFSGDFINEFLVEQGLQVLYTPHFPSSLNGFDAVFLSYGNYGQILSDGVLVTQEMTDIIIDYLVNGGKLYAESGSFFGCMDYFDYPNHDEAMELFGVDTIETPMTTNTLNLLTGQPGSICEGFVFEGSFQQPIWYIDKMTPNENGVAAFEEDNYGTVAVQGEGEYGQKTFCFSYALARLRDLYDVKRDSLMTSIVDFFELLYPVANFSSDTTVVKEGDSIHFTDLSTNNPISWQWEFMGGTAETSNEKDPAIVYDTPGKFDVTLIVTNDHGSDTLLIPDYVTVVENAGVVTLNSTTIKIYPNPASGISDIRYQISDTRYVSLKVFDINGRVVYELLSEKQNMGVHTVRFDGSDLTAGIYIIKLQAGAQVETAKVVVLR
jgi:subtilisin family serine protease